MSAALMADLSARARSGAARTEPGNPTSALVLQLFRGQMLEDELEHARVWLARGVPWRLARLVDGPARDEERLMRGFRRQAERPAPERGALQNLSFILANLGRHAHLPRLHAACEWAAGTTFAQTLHVGVYNVGERLGLGLGFPLGLVEPDVARAVGAEVVRELVSGRSDCRPSGG